MKAIILQSRYGPYHVARLKAAKQHLALHGIQVYGLQIAVRDQYNWDEQTSDQTISLFTLFDETSYESLIKSDIQEGVTTFLEKLDPQVVVVNGYVFPEALAGIKWCRTKGKGIVVACDSKKNDPNRVWYKELLKRFILANCDAAHVSGSLSKEYVTELGMSGDRIFKGYDCIDNSYFAERTTGKKLKYFGGTNRFFVSVNRFLPCKNILSLLAAYKKYSSICGSRSWSLVLIGDGEDTEKIETYIKDNKIKNVILPGFLQAHDIAAHYSMASCYVHASTQDTWGLVVNEAMASGLPVLLSNKIGCAPDLLEEGQNGWSFNPHSVEEISDALLRMHRLPDKQRKNMAVHSKKIINGWGLENFSEELEKAIQMAYANAQNRNCLASACVGLCLRIVP